MGKFAEIEERLFAAIADRIEELSPIGKGGDAGEFRRLLLDAAKGFDAARLEFEGGGGNG